MFVNIEQLVKEWALNEEINVLEGQVKKDLQALLTGGKKLTLDREWFEGLLRKK